MKRIFKQVDTDKFFLLIKERSSNLNTFIDCDCLGIPIVKKREWSTREQEQRRLIKGFENLIEL